MTENERASGRTRNALGGLILATAFLGGCGTTADPERPVRPASIVTPAPETRRPPQPVEAKNPPKAEALGEIDERNCIFFSSGSSAIEHDEMDKLRLAAELLKEDRESSIHLIGHASDNGSPSLDLAVADARLESVSASLKRLGVKAHQIKRMAKVGEKPPGACRSAECRRTMRRVELAFPPGK